MAFFFVVFCAQSWLWLQMAFNGLNAPPPDKHIFLDPEETK
jgi:hypothetical protein